LLLCIHPCVVPVLLHGVVRGVLGAAWCLSCCKVLRSHGWCLRHQAVLPRWQRVLSLVLLAAVHGTAWCCVQSSVVLCVLSTCEPSSWTPDL
jgi:hypothetical protein